MSLLPYYFVIIGHKFGSEPSGRQDKRKYMPSHIIYSIHKTKTKFFIRSATITVTESRETFFPLGFYNED